MSKGRRVAAVVAVLAVGGIGCGGSNDERTAAADGTLVIALPSQPDNLNPILGDSVYEGSLKLFNGLLRYAKDLTAEPDLASALPTRSADGKTVTVKLRTDVRFSDGAPLTANDVAFTYRAILDPDSASPMATPLETLDAVRAVDEHTVEFKLNRADPAFYDKLQVGIVPAAALEGRDLKTAAFNRKPIGTGPYVLERFEPGGRIVMKANPTHFRGRPGIERVVLTAVADENARVALLEKGTVDAAGIVPKLADRIRRNGNYNVFEVRTADARVAALPNGDPVLRDAAVRRALSYAVDRRRIVDSALAGAGEPAFGPIMPEHWAYSRVAERPFDPAEAERLLEAAGWTRSGDGVRSKRGRPLAFTLMYPSNDSVRKDIALAFASQMKDVGVDVELESLTFDVIEKRQDRGATEFGYGTPYDPDIELFGLFHSKFATADDDPFTNYPRTRDAAIDAALEAQRSTLDRSARKRHLARLQAALARDASWLWLVRLRHISVVSKRVKGVDPQVEPHAHGFSRGTSWNLEDWTLEPKA